MTIERLVRIAARMTLLGALAAGVLSCRSEPSCRRHPDGSVVACVDGAAVSRRQVEELVVEPWWTPGSASLPDPRKAAIERATRVLLFAAEAKRRGLALAPGVPNVPASWSQALIADEMAKRGISRDAVPDAEAAAYFRDNQELFHQIDRVDAIVIAFDDPALCTKVYGEAVSADEAGFRALAQKYSVDGATKDKGGDRVIIASTSEDRPMLKMVLSSPKPGQVLGPFKAADGHWYLLRIKASPIEHAKPFDELQALTVKNALVDQRRRALVEELDKALRSKAKIAVFDDALARVAVPEFK